MVRKYRRFNYARPSFLEGMARVLDVGGTLNVYHMPDIKPATQEETVIALRLHWVAVGQYMRDAIGEFEKAELGKPRENAAEQSSERTP